MNTTYPREQLLIRHAIVEIASLPDDDLAIVVEIVNYLKQQRQAVAGSATPPSAAEIRTQARQRANLLRAMPRQALVTQFQALSERILAQAMAQGTAIDGDWARD